MDTAGDLTQLVDDAAHPIDHLVQPFGQLARRGRCRRLRGPQSQGRADQVLLNAVVQVPLNAAAGHIGGADDPRGRR